MPIELKNVTYTYNRGAVCALRDVSLTVADGAYLGIMGAPGSGKTALLELAAGLIKPTQGAVELDGADINARRFDRAALRGAVGYLMAKPARQLFETTVEREVAFALRGKGLSREEQSARVSSALLRVGLEYDALRALSPLSLGADTQRRVALAGVIVAEPRFLLLDEPYAALDAPSRAELSALLKELNAKGTAVIVASRDSDALCESVLHVALLREGALLRVDRAREVFSDYYDLVQNGLDAPAVRLTAQLLRERGVDMPGNIVSNDQLVDRLKILMWRKLK